MPTLQFPDINPSNGPYCNDQAVYIGGEPVKVKMGNRKRACICPPLESCEGATGGLCQCNDLPDTLWWSSSNPVQFPFDWFFIPRPSNGEYVLIPGTPRQERATRIDDNRWDLPGADRTLVCSGGGGGSGGGSGSTQMRFRDGRSGFYEANEDCDCRPLRTQYINGNIIFPELVTESRCPNNMILACQENCNPTCPTTAGPWMLLEIEIGGVTYSEFVLPADIVPNHERWVFRVSSFSGFELFPGFPVNEGISTQWWGDLTLTMHCGDVGTYFDVELQIVRYTTNPIQALTNDYTRVGTTQNWNPCESDATQGSFELRPGVGFTDPRLPAFVFVNVTAIPLCPF